MPMNNAQQIWDQRYGQGQSSRADDWLRQWGGNWLTPGAAARALDIGCGSGHETAALLALGWQVTATEISATALAAAELRNPAARHLLADVRTMPEIAGASLDLAVAHLSLHYFDRAGSLQAFAEIARLLKPGGLLLGSVNADDDVNYGAPADASGWDLTLVDGVPKQFFTSSKLLSCLRADFELLELRKSTSHRYGAPKSVWDFAARRSESLAAGRVPHEAGHRGPLQGLSTVSGPSSKA